MNDPLRRFMIWSVTLFGLLLTAVTVGASLRLWTLRDALADDNPVSRAEVVSMQPYLDEPPVILVIGPTGAEVRVHGTAYLNPPYPQEGEYIDVVFRQGGDATTSGAAQRESDSSAGLLIVGCWLLWGVLIAASWLGCGFLLDAARPWWGRSAPRQSARRRARDGEWDVGTSGRSEVERPRP